MSPMNMPGVMSPFVSGNRSTLIISRESSIVIRLEPFRRTKYLALTPTEIFRAASYFSSHCRFTFSV